MDLRRVRHLASHDLARIEAVCREAARRYESGRSTMTQFFDPEHPTKQQIKEYGLGARGRIGIDRWFIAQLRSLRPQRPGARSWTLIVRLMIDIQQNNVRQVRAGQDGHLTAFADAYGQTKGLHADLWELGRAAGFTGTSPCAAVV
jgi:hypothetical protein